MRLVAAAIICFSLYASLSLAEAGTHGSPGAAFSSSDETYEKDLKTVLDRGLAARKKIGLKDDDPAPMLDFLAKHPDWTGKHKVEITAIAHSNRDLKRAKAALKSLLASLVEEADFQKAFREALAKKVNFIFREQAFEEGAKYLRTGVPGTGIVASNVVQTLRPMKNALLGLDLNTPDDPK